ncbi:tetratricopeptide repeat protein [Candidatus Dependentiae bacterium]|nr:tetratricopeptide repeat protein [Candidatus Dependentiae bacterium]
MRALIKKAREWPYVIPHSFAIVFLSIMTLMLYVPTLHYGFVFDDYPTILEYPHMHTSHWSAVFFSSSRWVARILQRLGFIISGMHPFGFRLINMIVHLAAGLLVYYLISILCRQLKQEWFAQHSSLLGLLTGLLFLIHPAQTQTATYMTQMGTEGVAGFFVLLVSVLFTKALLSKNVVFKITWIITMLGAAYIGCGTKEIIVVLPGLLILTDLLLIAQGNCIAFLRRLPLHALIASVVFFGLARVGMHVKRVVSEAPKVELPNNRGNVVTESFQEPIKPNLYRWTQPKILLHYLRIFFLPVDLCFEYGTKLVKHPFAPDVIYPVLLWLSCLIAAAWFFLKQTMLPLAFGLGWFLAVMLPRAIAPSQELVCDYKAYIASVGVLFIVAVLTTYVVEWIAVYFKESARPIFLLGSIGIFISVIGVGAHVRNLVWSDELTFWADVVRKVPTRSRAYNNLAIAHLVKNDVQKAISFFEEAIRIDKNYGEPHVNLALIYEQQGDREKATKHYEAALMSGELHHQLFFNLGLFNKNGGEVELAERAFRKALEIRSFYPQARFELAKILQAKKSYVELVVLCEETFQLQAVGTFPFAELYGSTLFEINDTKKAKKVLLQLDTKDPRIAFMIGCCLIDENRHADSLKYFEIAYTYDRHNVSVAYNFSQALMHTGRYERALEMLGRCNNVVDQMPMVPYFKAQCLQNMGRAGETKELLVNIIKTTKHPEVRNNAEAFLKTI